jgi:hypothetical protein
MTSTEDRIATPAAPTGRRRDRGPIAWGTVGLRLDRRAADRARRTQSLMAFDVQVATVHSPLVRLVNVVHVPHLDDYCSLAYAGPRNRGFRIVQRLASDSSMEEELALTGDDYAWVTGSERRYALYTGMYLTEPIDGRYWAPSRRRLVWYAEGIRLELEAVLDGATSIDGMVRIADGVRPLREVLPERMRS